MHHQRKPRLVSSSCLAIYELNILLEGQTKKISTVTHKASLGQMPETARPPGPDGYLWGGGGGRAFTERPATGIYTG